MWQWSLFYERTKTYITNSANYYHGKLQNYWYYYYKEPCYNRNIKLDEYSIL